MNSTDNSTQASIIKFTSSSLEQGLPEATRPLHLLTRTATGLMTNTAGTTYFYPPECCQEQPYNAYAADVLILLSSLLYSFGLWELHYSLWW